MLWAKDGYECESRTVKGFGSGKSAIPPLLSKNYFKANA